MKLSPSELNKHLLREIEFIFKDIDSEFRKLPEFDFKPVTNISDIKEGTRTYSFNVLNDEYYLYAFPKPEAEGMYIETHIYKVLPTQREDISIPELKVRYDAPYEVEQYHNNEPVFSCWFNSDVEQSKFPNNELASRYVKRFTDYLHKKARLDLSNS